MDGPPDTWPFRDISGPKANCSPDFPSNPGSFISQLSLSKALLQAEPLAAVEAEALVSATLCLFCWPSY